MTEFKAATLYDPNDPSKRTAVKTKAEADRLFGAGYKVETTPYVKPVTPESPEIKREEDGGISTLQTPLQTFKTGNNLLNVLKQGIKMKQGFNKDLNKSKISWRQKQAEAYMPFKDERLRELSAGDQAGLRASRYASANAQVEAIKSEEKYREQELDDVMAIAESLQKDKDTSEKDAIALAQARLNLYKSQKDLGLPVGLDDIYGEGNVPDDVTETPDGIKSGGSLSWRNNNPGNLKYSSWQDEFGAVKDPNSAFAQFKTEEDAFRAYKALLTSPTGVYAGLTPNEAMWKWSGGGKDTVPSYTYDDLIKLGAPAMSVGSMADFSDTDWRMIFEAQRQREGWTEGKIIGETAEQPLDLSEAKKTAIMSSAGLTNAEVADYSPDQWIALTNTVRDASLDHAKLFLADQLEKLGGVATAEQGNQIREKMLQDYGQILNSSELDSVMTLGGFESTKAMFSAGGGWKSVNK